MDKLKIDPTAKTPLIELDNESGRLLIQGRSIPENSVDFFQPVYDWIDGYMEAPMDKTEMDVKLEYFNTSSSKCILNVLKKLEQLNRENRSAVQINWYYEEDDEDMLEAGEDFDIIIGIPFNMIAIEEFEQNF